MNDNNKSETREVLEQLVAHFGQPIHAQVIIDSYSKDATTVPLLSSTTNGPRKEQLERQERPIPPIVQLWLDRLLSSTLQSQASPNLITELTVDGGDCGGNTHCRMNTSIAVILSEWLCGYEQVVRPRIFQATSVAFGERPIFDERCVPTLKNYELVLSKLLLKSMDTKVKKRSISTTVSRVPSLDPKRKLLRIINLLCTDITLLTTVSSTSTTSSTSDSESKKDAKNHFRRNIGLPSLLQIMANTLESLKQEISITSATVENNQGSTQCHDFASECLASLRLCAVTILAFDFLDDCDEDSSRTKSPQSALTAILPHNLSRSLSTVELSRKNDLNLVQCMLRRIEPSSSDTFSHVDTPVQQYLERALDDDSISYDDIDDDYWSQLLSTFRDSLSSAGWMDSNPNNLRGTVRIVHGIWRSMESLLNILSIENGRFRDRIIKDIGVVLNADASDSEKHRKWRTSVLEKLGGPDPLLRDARAHFFGRNVHGMEDLTQARSKSNHDKVVETEASAVVIKMGRRVTKTKKNTNADGSPIDGPEYERVPSRTAAALNAFRVLLVPEFMEETNDTCRENILQNVFPICAALLDSSNAAFNTLGAAGLARAIDAIAPRSIDLASKDLTSGQDASNTITTITGNEVWTNFTENVLAVLERSLQSNCDHGPVVVAIGRLQSRLFEIMLSGAMRTMNEDVEERFQRRRRITTKQWLSKLERSNYRPATARQQLELLLGGVIPLLSQHATDERSGADGMEFGRLGLAALLPITTKNTIEVDITRESSVESIGRKTQMASMVALINLIFAAHPIIARHGGKIMSHLLTAAVSTIPSSGNQSDYESEEGTLEEISPRLVSVRSMAVLVAAIGLVVCESKFASQVLDSIEGDRDQYQQSLLTTVSEVRRVAEGLRSIK